MRCFHFQNITIYSAANSQNISHAKGGNEQRGGYVPIRNAVHESESEPEPETM